MQKSIFDFKKNKAQNSASSTLKEYKMYLSPIFIWQFIKNSSIIKIICNKKCTKCCLKEQKSIHHISYQKEEIA